MRKNKNDYSVIFFFPDRQPFKLTYVGSVYAAFEWVRKNISRNIDYANVYDRRDGTFIHRQKANEYIINKP